MPRENPKVITQAGSGSDKGSAVQAEQGISFTQLRAAIKGRVITPNDAGYDQARLVFYGKFNRRPAIIVKAAGATDVSQVVSFAREQRLELAIRSGGHSLAGHSTS